jgi:hypothetical protein
MRNDGTERRLLFDSKDLFSDDNQVTISHSISESGRIAFGASYETESMILVLDHSANLLLRLTVLDEQPFLLAYPHFLKSGAHPVPRSE